MKRLLLVLAIIALVGTLSLGLSYEELPLDLDNETSHTITVYISYSDWEQPSGEISQIPPYSEHTVHAIRDPGAGGFFCGGSNERALNQIYYIWAEDEYYYPVYKVSFSYSKLKEQGFKIVFPSTIVFSTKPIPMANLVITASNNQVNISWKQDNYRHKGFYIDRALDVNFTIDPISYHVLANGSSYVDYAVKPNTTYWYRVVTYNDTEGITYGESVRVTTG
jgi:hypothetical protein